MLVLLAVLLPSPTGVGAEEESASTTNEGIKVDAALEALVQDVGPTLGERFAGAWANPDGTITVALTDSDPVPSPLSADRRVHIVTRRFSTNRLNSAIQTVTDRLNTALAPGAEPGSLDRWPFSGTINTKRSIVEVTIDKEHQAKQPLIEAALADELKAGTVEITYGEAKQVEPIVSHCGTRENCAAPFRGGIAASPGCTLGFVMRNRWTGVRFQSTARHCGALSTWLHGGRNIGPYYNGYDSGAVDFQSIAQTNQAERAPSNFVYRFGDDDTPITTKITSPGTSLLTNRLCVEGRFTQNCGPLTSYNYTAGGRCCFGEIPLSSCFGDSGAPVVNDSTNRAYGMAYAKTKLTPEQDCNPSHYFTWVPNFETGTGMDVLLTNTTETLGWGQRLNPGMELRSPNGQYLLIMQGDGNLVLYNCCGTALWHTVTYPNPGAFAVMQNDGNLVVYRSNGTPLWNRPTGGWVAKSYLTLQDDANLVIYGPSRIVSWHRFCSC